jgi:hypothetical protein
VKISQIAVQFAVPTQTAEEKIHESIAVEIAGSNSGTRFQHAIRRRSRFSQRIGEMDSSGF